MSLDWKSRDEIERSLKRDIVSVLSAAGVQLEANPYMAEAVADEILRLTTRYNAASESEKEELYRRGERAIIQRILDADERQGQKIG